MIINEITKADIADASKLYVNVFTSKPWLEEWNEDWAKERITWFFNSPGFYGFYAVHNDQKPA